MKRLIKHVHANNYVKDVLALMADNGPPQPFNSEGAAGHAALESLGLTNERTGSDIWDQLSAATTTQNVRTPSITAKTTIYLRGNIQSRILKERPEPLS